MRAAELPSPAGHACGGTPVQDQQARSGSELEGVAFGMALPYAADRRRPTGQKPVPRFAPTRR
jgi:hypothetical protein